MPITNPPSANMGIVTPVVLGEVGPYWASELNTALLTTIDAHDHATGKGVKVPVAGLNINANLPMTGYAVTASNYYGLTARALPAGALPVTLFAVSTAGNTELFYEDSTGRDVQITNAGQVGGSVSIDKGFTGNYDSTPGAGTASAYYDSASGTFAFYRVPGAVYDTSAHASVTAGATLIQKTGATLTVRDAVEGTVAATAKGWQMSAAASAATGYWYLYDTVSSSYAMGAELTSQASSWGAGLLLNGFTTVSSMFGARGQLNTGNVPLGGLGITAHSTAAIANGFGVRLNFAAARTTDSAPGVFDGAVDTIGRIEYVAQTIGSRYWGIRISDYAANTRATVFESDGNAHIGVGGIFDTSFGVTLYGDVGPVSTTHNLGSATAYWATVYGKKFQGIAGTTTTIAAPAAMSLTAGTTITANAPVHATYFAPDSSAAGPVATVGGLALNNQVLAWATLTTANVVTAGYGVASVSYAAGVATITLTTATSTNNALFVTYNTATGFGATLVAVFTSTTTITVTDSTGINRNLYFMMVGTP